MLRVVFRVGEILAPRVVARLATRIWFTLPPRPWDHALPDGGTAFEVRWRNVGIRGRTWGEGPVVYLVHGWGGRASQLAALVEPLVDDGYQVVIFDGPSHGASDAGALGPRSTHGVELSQAFDAVVARFGPAHAVVAHSFGAITTLLTMKYGWLTTGRLVLLAPLVEFSTTFDGFQRMLGIGPRTRRRSDELIPARVGLPIEDFSLGRLLDDLGPVPVLVVHDRDDWQTSYADSAALAAVRDQVSMVSTDGLGHLLVLRDRSVIAEVTEFLGAGRQQMDLPTSA